MIFQRRARDEREDRPITVVVVDRQTLVCEGLGRILAAEADIVVVGSASDSLAAVALAERLQPAVVILDAELPQAEETIRGVAAASRTAAVLILPAVDDAEQGVLLLRAGALGYLCKRATGQDLIAEDGSWLGLRRAAVRGLDGLLRGLQRLADGPRAINSGVFAHLCQGICLVEAWVVGASTRHAWTVANRALLDNILAAVRHDPCVRVLVTVDCRRRHQHVTWLRHNAEVELVDFWTL
jgi:CheY-like chemotaxis protein